MGARQRLVLLAGVSGTVLILLGRTAHGAAEQLAKVPPQSWGLSELSDAVVAGTCACGALGALWHVVSALLALMTLPAASGTTPLRPGGVSALAARVLQAWGAPVVRRITASALLVSLSSAPALAAQETGGGDDLGWRPTSSAPASPPSQSSTPSEPEQSPSSTSTGSGDSDGASARIDFYEVDGDVYFGEITFTDADGLSDFTPSRYDRVFGDRIILPEKKCFKGVML